MADQPYRDPKTTKIEDWPWRALEPVREKLDLSEVPDYIQKGFGQFMTEQAGRSKRGEMTPRDLIKAYTIAQSSIGRGGLSHATATKTGMRLPNTGGEVRPEGAFAEWLGSREGQRYLDAAERGTADMTAIGDLQGKFAPFGKHNDQAEKMVLAAKMAQIMGSGLNKALTGSTDEYRDYAEKMKGIAGAKSGFIGSLLGRGDLPTLDARQLNLHALPASVGIGAIMARGKGKGAREAVDRLAARQRAMRLALDPSLDPHYQHLAHHAVWDKASGTETTHDDLMRAMRGYAQGGNVEPTPDQMRQMLANRPQGLKEGAQPEPKLLHPSTPEYQNLLAKYRDKAKLSAAENVQLGLSHPVSKVKLRAPIHELTYQEQEDPNQPMVPERRITPEDLYKSKGAGIGFLGDAARLALLTHVGKEKLPRPVRLQAGVNFMRGVKPEGESSGWASAPSVISDLANKTREAAKIPGVENVLGLTASMTPTGVDYGRPLSKVLVGQLENQQPTKETAKLFNAAMRMKFPDFAGVDRPDLLHDQLMAPGAKSAAMRKAFVGLMDMKPFQAVGMPNVGHARVAISDPEQLHLPTNSIGLGISNLDPTGRVIKNPSKPHEDYTDELAQKHYMGRFEVPMSRGDVFSDFEAMRRAANKDPTDDPRSFDFSLPIQVFNQQWLDTIMPKYLAKRKALLGFAEGGEVKDAEPSQDEMMAHIMLKGMANLKDVGANEAPNMRIKAYVPPAGGPGLPVGGVDFQPEAQGQQMLPGQPPAPGQPPQAGGPPPGAPGQPPASPQGQNPNAPRSNILQMTPQGQAMAAMRASPPPGMPPPKMAEGGSTTPSVEEMKRALGKFLEGSHTPMRLYHGTKATEGGKGKEAIRNLKASKEGALGSGVYMTPNPEFASEYANTSGGNVLPVHARITNPLVIRSKRGQDPMIMALVQLGMTPEKAASMVEKAYEQKGYIGKQVQQRAQAAGHDALMQYRDGDLSEVVHYNPRMIKSATGNRGTYDTSKDDLSMATGGSTTPSVEEMKQALMDKDEPVRMKLKSSDNSASKRMIDDVYSKYPTHPFNAQQRAMAEGEGDDQTLGTFELKPSMSARNAVELSWLSAYPHKQGVGSRTLQKLQEHAAEHNVGLTLFPWEHGGVSQSKLIKFYKKHGFAPNMKGSKTMVWRPEQKADGGTVKDYIRITERKL